MASLIIKQSFCEPSGFLDKCLDILCASKGIFKANSKTVLKDVYDDMRTNLNSSQYIIYPVGGSIVSTTVNKGTISKNNMIYAGHDFPVWLNDPTSAKYRVMVVSQDPRRNDQEMGNGKYELGCSTPFGLHSMWWRSNKTKGFVHWLFDKLLAEYGPQMSVYYTDVYKFRGVGLKSVLDTSNFDVYKDILRQEIELFEPNVVLLMGNEAQEAYNGVMNTVTTAIKPAGIETPHPNARIKDKKYWGKYEMAKFDIDSKIEIVINEIKQKLNKNKTIMALGLSKKVSDKFKNQANLEKTIDEIGMCDAKEAVVLTNQFLQQLCVYVFRWKNENFNGDFNILWDIVDDLDPKDDELLLRQVKRVLGLSRLKNISFSCDSFKEFVKEQADLEDFLTE